MPALLPAVAVETLFTTAALAPTLTAAVAAPAVIAPTVAATLPGVVASGTGTMAGTLAGGTTAAGTVAGTGATLPGIVAGGTNTMAGTLAGAAPEAAGIMSGGAATVPTAAGSTAATTAGADVTAAQTYGQVNAANPAVAPPVPAPAQPLGITPQASSVPQFGAPPGAPPSPYASPMLNPTNTMPEGFKLADPIKLEPGIAGSNATKTAMERGGQSAFKLIGQMTDFAKENPITSLGGVMTAQKLGMFGGNDSGPKKDEYKRTPYDGLSPTFAATEEGTYKAPGGASPYLYGFADGGITGPVEQMSNMNAIGGNEMYPMANIPRLEYANPVQQRPISENIMTMGGDAPTDPYTGQLKFSEGGSTYDNDKEAAKVSAMRKRYSKMMGDNSNMEENISDMKSAVARAQSKSGIVGHGIDNLTQAAGPAAEKDLKKLKTKYKIKSYLPEMLTPEGGSMEYAASGGIMHGLGGYSDYASGGRLLKGPGDGVSDSIPAVIGSKQPARLADGEFVIPARIVSELGNGSTEAGARQLYAMMERIQKNRKKSVGKGKVAVDSKSKKHLPA